MPFMKTSLTSVTVDEFASASREIMWNVNQPFTPYLMYGLMVLSLIVAGAGLFRRIEIWRGGKASPQHKLYLKDRLLTLLTDGLFQRGVSRERQAALFHWLIYFGFMVLLFTTTMVMLDHDFGFDIYRGRFYLWLTVLSDVFGLGLLFGVAMAAHRRYLTKPDQLHSKPGDNWFLSILALLVIQGFLLEGLRIKVTEDPWAAFSPVGNVIARFFWFIANDSARTLHFITWWFHTITVFILIALLPYSKFFHVISSPLNLFFKKTARAVLGTARQTTRAVPNTARPKGQLEPVGDIEKLLETAEDEVKFGLGSILDYSWKHLLDLDACTSCGRCQAVCPAYLSGKPLSPKWMILDTRNHLLALEANNKLAPSALPKPLQSINSKLTENFLAKAGVIRNEANSGDSFKAQGEYRGNNVLVQESILELGASTEARIAGDVIDQEVFWSCTTCMACVESCPVGINHVDHIVGNRRNMVLMHGEVPNEAQATLRALETRRNPFGKPEDRMNWAAGLDVPILQPGDSVQYLYWVGCVSAYDTRKQKIARSLVTLLKSAGVSFGVLGNAEGCSGDPARRLGEENLFQSLSKSNIELLKSVSFETLVANCPHCFNTIKNEYPEFGNLGDNREPEIIHHSQLLKRLMAQGRLNIKEGSDTSYTFHDPCYLGRYNDEYDAPREVVSKVSRLKIVEMERSRNKGLCCGAGGGHFWMDRKIGERVNVIRVNEAAETGAEKIASACPFCMQMLEDGAKLTNRESTLEVKDIAEVLAEALV